MQTEGASSIRSIGRGFAILQAINRYGSISMTDIAAEARVPYPTTCRIVQTLIGMGMVERETGRKRYRPTALVQTLSMGYQREDRLAELARPHMAELTRDIVWPVYMCCRIGPKMMVKETTDSMTSLAFSHCHPGYTVPLTESSSGKVYLAFCPDDERELLLRGVSREPSYGAQSFDEVLQTVRRDGFATATRHRYTENPGKTSAISAPIIAPDGEVSALSMLFFSSAMSINDAIDRFADKVKNAAAAISTELAAA